MSVQSFLHFCLHVILVHKFTTQRSFDFGSLLSIGNGSHTNKHRTEFVALFRTEVNLLAFSTAIPRYKGRLLVCSKDISPPLCSLSYLALSVSSFWLSFLPDQITPLANESWMLLIQRHHTDRTLWRLPTDIHPQPEDEIRCSKVHLRNIEIGRRRDLRG